MTEQSGGQKSTMKEKPPLSGRTAKSDRGIPRTSTDGDLRNNSSTKKSGVKERGGSLKIKQNTRAEDSNAGNQKLSKNTYSSPAGSSDSPRRKKTLERQSSTKSDSRKTAKVDALVSKQNGSTGSEDKMVSATMKGLWKKAYKSLKANSEKGSLLKRSSSILKRRDSKESSPDDNLIDAKDIDPVYSLLKCAADLPRSVRSCASSASCQGPPRSFTNCTIVTSQSSSPTSSVSSVSPKTRRKKLNSRMKSFSLDTPDVSKHLTIDESTKKKSSSFTTNTCISYPVMDQPASNSKKKFFFSKRSASVDIEGCSSGKGSSSSSISPRQSPKNMKKLNQDPHIVLYNFRGKEKDHLDLRAGWRVLVTNSSDKDWWKGKCNGKTGYFPATYVIPAVQSQRVFQVTQPVSTADTQARFLRLHKDQIVIQAGEEESGKILVRTANKKESLVPLLYLNEL